MTKFNKSPWVKDEFIQGYQDGADIFIVDVVLAPSEALEQWYLLLWKQWIDERKSFLAIKDNRYNNVLKEYKNNTNDKPDTLDVQLKALQTIGFKEVDCFYKYGIFTMYRGRKFGGQVRCSMFTSSNTTRNKKTLREPRSRRQGSR